MEQGEGNLNEAEWIFFNLLDDDKLFNSNKFKKALVQQKARRAAEEQRKAGKLC